MTDDAQRRAALRAIKKEHGKAALTFIQRQIGDAVRGSDPEMIEYWTALAKLHERK